MAAAGTFQPRARKVDAIGAGLDRHAMLAEVFVKMDADHSGTVDLAEFMGIFSAVGEKNAARDMALMDTKGDDTSQEFTKYEGHDRSTKKVNVSDGLLQQDEFIFHMLEQLDVKTDVEFKKIIDLYNERIDQGERALKLRKIFAQMDVDGSGFVDVVELKVLLEAGSTKQAAPVGSGEEPKGCFKWVTPDLLKKMDVNDDGQLGIDEWVHIILAAEEPSSDSEFEGAVSEWMEVVKKGRRITLLRLVFSRMDADQSGTVELDEMISLADGETEAAAVSDMLRMIDEVYGDKDGKISEDEWVRAMIDAYQGDDDAKLKAECDTLSEVLHKNQRSEWRKRYRNKDAANLVIGARAAGVTHFVLVRHGNAGQLPSTKPGQPHGWGMDDRSRTLTNRGQAQCVAARAAWFSKCPARPTVVCSPAERAEATAHFMANEEDTPREVPPKQPLLTIASLHPAGLEANICEALFARFGYGPLRQYLDAEGGEMAFGRYAQAVSGELAIKFRLSPLMGETGTYIAVFGHAVWLNAIAYAIATAAGLSDEELDFLLDLELGECEAIHVPLYSSDFGGKVQKMVVPL